MEGTFYTKKTDLIKKIKNFYKGGVRKKFFYPPPPQNSKSFLSIYQIGL